MREREFYILMVPLGPRLVLSTSMRPLAALMFMCSAADLLSTSALGFSTRSDMADAFPRSLARFPRRSRRWRRRRRGGGEGSARARCVEGGEGREAEREQ